MEDEEVANRRLLSGISSATPTPPKDTSQRRMRIGAAATFAFVAASVAMSVAWSSSAAPHVTPAQGKKELDAVSFTPGLLNDGTRARARSPALLQNPLFSLCSSSPSPR